MLFGLFGKPRQPITTRDGLDDFLDSNGAYLVQRCLYEYARGAAGYQWQPLMDEAIFKAAMERSRWLAFPIGLAAVAEVAEGVLRPAAGTNAAAVAEAVVRACDRVLDRHSPPERIESSEWAAARAAVAQRLARADSARLRAVHDVARSIAKEVFGLIPIVEQFRGRDPDLARNNLSVSLIAIHTEFVKRADAPTLVAALLA